MNKATGCTRVDVISVLNELAKRNYINPISKYPILQIHKNNTGNNDLSNDRIDKSRGSSNILILPTNAKYVFFCSQYLFVIIWLKATNVMKFHTKINLVS